ncbi:unnamed protein product [Symbiodinium sp. CCMP2592]|nr:unnamed protein product [Symbiodinium sp. CCMP2592]
MPPKATEKSSKAGKGSQKGEAPQVTRIDFGLPPAVTTSLQSISSRATQDLWLQANFNQEDATAEQQAQRRANAISKLSKRLTGNARAKDELKTSLQQWLSTIGLHLLGLISRVRAIGDKIDEDTRGAVQEMQAVLAEQQSSASSDRVALAQSSLGRVWSLSQVAEVQAIASALRTFSSGALAGPPDPTSAAWRLGEGSVPARTPPPVPFPARFWRSCVVRARSLCKVQRSCPENTHGAEGQMVGTGDMGSEASFGLPGRSHMVGVDYGMGDTPVSVQFGAGTEQASASGPPSMSSGGRWRKRSGGGTERPAKRRTPESLSRPPVTEITDNDTELIPDLSHNGPVAPAAPQAQDWVAAWQALLRFAVDSGADPVGDLTACPRQDAALPVTTDAQAEPLVRQRVEQTWQALKDGVSGEADADLPSLHRLLAEALHQLRGCAGALHAAPQGLLVAAHISVGGLLDPFAYAPATAQEWLFPGLLTEAGLPCKGFIALEASAHHHVQTILRQPCPFLESVGLETTQELTFAWHQWCGLTVCRLVILVGKLCIVYVAFRRACTVSDRFQTAYGPRLSFERKWQLGCTVVASALWACVVLAPVSAIRFTILALACETCALRVVRARVLTYLELFCGLQTLLALQCCSLPSRSPRRLVRCNIVHGKRVAPGSAAGRHSNPRYTALTFFLLYLSLVDGASLRTATQLGSLGLALCRPVASVQLHVHGFHENRPVISTGPVLPTPSVEVMCHVYPVGRAGNSMLSRSDRHRRSLAVFVGQPPGSPVLEPCPLLFMADEWMHGPLLWGQIAAALGFRDDVFSVTTLQSPLPGLPGEQLLMTPRSLPWRYAWLPVDLRAVGGRICMLMCVRDSSCQAIAQLAITAQELQLRVDGLLGRCHWGWLTLSSQPLFLQGVDALQFASGPGPESLQAPLGASLDPPLSLLSAMQVSLPSGQAGADIFQGYSNNQAILITPNGLVYVEVPVFADAATFRRIVSFRASPTARGGVMRIWQPLPSLPLVQFLEIHCHSDEVPCILDFRPLGWRIVTACVRPPITALRMLDEAIRRNNGGIPADWLDQCADGRFGLLHRESIVLPDQLLHGNLPVVVMFFPHIFRQDSSSSSEQQVGGRPPPSGEDVDGPVSSHTLFLPTATSGVTPDVFLGTEGVGLNPPGEDLSFVPEGGAGTSASCTSMQTPTLLLGTLLSTLHSFAVVDLKGLPLALLLFVAFRPSTAVQVHSAPGSPRQVLQGASLARDRDLAAPPLAHVDLQGMWQRTGDFGDALLWPSLGDSSRRFLVTCKIWAPESSLVLQFLGDMDAGEVAAELHRQAVRLGRPHLVAASTGPTFDKVHLVAAASGREHITVLVDACVDLCCVDLPAAYTSRDVIVAVAQFLQHDAFQILCGRGLRLRHGDVVTVKPARPTQHFDISSLLLPLPRCSTAAWLAPVRHVSVVQAAEGVHTFSVPASTTVTAEVLRLLMSKTCTGKFSFFDLPFPDVLPHASFVAIGRRQCVVVYRVNDRADPASLGLILCFEGRFVSYDEFLLQLASRTELPARLLRSLQSHGMTVLTWETTALPGDPTCRLWCVHVVVDMNRAFSAGLRFSRAVRPIIHVPIPLQLPSGVRTSDAGVQTGGPFLVPDTHPLSMPALPVDCVVGLSPPNPSIWSSLWCEHCRLKCVVPCIPGFALWAIRDGALVFGVCSAAPSWDNVANVLALSLWELPQTFLYDEGKVWPYPGDLHDVADRCVNIGHDSHDGVAQLARQCEWQQPAPPPAPSSLAAAAFLASGQVRVLALLASLAIGAGGVQVNAPPGRLRPHDTFVTFVQDRRDFARTCTLSWTHELGRQTHGFGVSPTSLGAFIERNGPSDVQLHLWLPGRGPIHIRVSAAYIEQHLRAYLAAFLPSPTYRLHVAFDSCPHVLELVVVPPGSGVWWIIRDEGGRELLRPVTQHFTTHCHFHFCTLDPDGSVLQLEPSSAVRDGLVPPQGARAVITQGLPHLLGHCVQGAVRIAAARSPRTLVGVALWLVSLNSVVVAMQPGSAPGPSEYAIIPAVQPPDPSPDVIRIWTLNVREPIDFPWLPQGYPTRWLCELVSRLHNIASPGEFRSTHHPATDPVQHLMFVPVVPRTVPPSRFWLLHFGDSATVTFGHHPFDWDILAAHLRALFHHELVPERRPALGFGGNLFPPGVGLPEFPSGAIIQGPFFRTTPSRGPLHEPPIVVGVDGQRLDGNGARPPCHDCATQTNLTGEGVGIDHAAVLRVNDLARDLAYHAARLWQGLAEPDAEPVGDSGRVLQASATPARPVDLLDLDPSRGDRDASPAAAWLILCLGRQAGTFLRHLHLVGCVLLLPGWVSASIISPPGSSSDEEGSSPATVTTFNAATHGAGRAPHVRPAGPPPPTPANAPPVASRVLYLQAATPVEDYSLGQWPPVGPARATVSPSAVTTVQVQLSQFQHGVRAVVDAIPPGTPICIHNPFTARAQCSWLEYHAGVEISPFTVFQDHANHRGWRGLALLHPQPDALAVHLIGQPLHPDNAAVGIVLRDRLVPCCLPRCVRASALHSLHVGDDVCDLHFSGLIHDEADTVQLRDGDCLGARIRPPRPSATRPEVAYATPASADAGAPVAEDRSSSILGALGWAASPLRYLGLFLFGRGWRHAGPGWIVVCFGTLAVSAMHRPGGFPWGEHPRNRELRDITAHDPVYVVLHSPFLGAYPAYTASRDTRHHVIWAQFLNDEPALPADFFPVWPGPAFNELSIVPIGADPAIVTLMLQWRGLPRAIVAPRVMTVKWLMSLIARLVGRNVGEIAVPHGLAVAEFFDVPPAALKFRNGDVVYALEAQDADDEALQAVEPWHLQDGLAAQHAPWALGFRLMFDVQVQLLRPDRPPVLARVAAEEAWCPESHCFSGDFQLRFPGMWTPVQWTSARQVQLVQVCNVAAQVHVVVATPGERLCRVSDRFVSKYTLASSLNLDPVSVCVGGIPAYALEQSCELRNGDVVFGNAEQGDSSGSVGPLARAVLAAVLWAAVTHWPDRVGWSLLAMLVLGQCANHDGTLFGCHAMQLQAAPVAAGPESAGPGVPRASAPSRLMQVHVADPFAAWTVVRVDESEIFPSLLEVCPGALASWHRGFAIADSTSVGLHVAVPHPGRGLVCVLIVGLGQRLCVLLPAFLTLRAAERAVSLRMGQLVALQLGPGLVAESRQLGAFLALRTGDTLGVRLVSTLSFAMTPPLPHFPTWQRAHAEGAWRTDFVVDHPSSLLLWRPNCPTRLLCFGPNQRWSAAQATILGDDTPFAEGRWTPCVGHQGVIPWLLFQATEPSQVHVIRTHSCTECVAVNRDAAYDMWIDGFQVRPPTARPDKITRVREGDWWLKAVASGGGLVSGASRGSRFFLLLAVSFLHFPAVSAASSSEGCRSPDSSEARTIRSRGRWDARSRSRSPPSVVHFPPRIDWTDGEPFILHAGWRLHEGDGLTAFDQCYLRPDQATVRTLCPILGWSAAEAADLGRSWTYFDRIGQRFCGSWCTRFFPVRGVRPLTEVVLAPVAPCGLATVIIHTLDETGAFLLPVDTTPAAIQAAAAMRSPQVRSWHLMLPPALRAVHEHQVIRLRNGDLFGLQPCPGQPGYAPRPTLNFPSLEVARQVASWSLPFRFDTGDTATFWSTSSRVGRSVTIRGGGIWDPRGPTFRSPNGQQMLGSWVPVLQGGLTRLHFVSRTLPVEALVICLIPPTDEPIGVFLAGICACRPPFGWRLVPSIRRSRAGGSLRDADVLEVDPDATFTWDPFDGRPPLLAEDTPGQDDRQVDPDSSWDLGFPAAISAASCVLSKRSFSWALLLYGWLSLSGVWGMYQPVDTAPAPIRAGFFPWRAPAGHENMQDLTERATLEVVYVSPFTGPQVLGQVPTSASPDHLLDRASQLEPGWGTGIAPVWPATPLPFLMVVPQPPCLELVCVVVSSLEDHFALCIPRVAPLEWIAQVLRYSHSLHALSLRAPATVRDLASDVYWRSGDLLVALPPAVFEPTYSPPCFATATQLRHCAIWSVDFSVSSTIEVVLWRPSVRPLRSRIPALARWNALDLTFEGVFAQRFPGRWAPVPWAADDLPHLVQCSQSADDVTVIVESSVGCFCSEIPACVDAWQLWTALPTLPSQPQVLGVPKAELRHGTLLRNGDVVSGTSPREQLPVWIALSLSLLWRWPCLGGASLLFILTPEVRAVRTPASGTNTEYLHRVWNPAGMVQGPFPGPSHRCPDVLRHSIPAWDHFVRVRPTQHVAFIDWVPAPPDPDSVIVLLHGGVSSRAVMLPWRASPQEVLDRLRAFAPLASSVSATPAAWRGTSLSRSPILYLRSGDVLCLDSVSWYPRLRQPQTLEWPTVQFAAAFAFWGHPFKVLEPGLIFAWQSGAVLPLCVPTVRGERWDPSRGTFFPSLAPFSFSRWVPAVRVDPLGLHLVEESTQGTIAHTLACTYPPRVCATEVCLSPYAPRDGDDFGRRTTGIPGLGLWIGFLTQGARLRCRPAFYILGLLWLPLFVGSGPMPHPHAWRPEIVIYPDPGISQLSGRAFSSWESSLSDVYGRAWGAPAVYGPPGAARAARHDSCSIDLNDAGYHYAGLAAHYLARPLPLHLPALLPGMYHGGWQRFPPWAGGAPDEVLIATDGSGTHSGGWAFAAWCCWKGAWYRVGWDAGALGMTPWLPSLPEGGTDLRSYAGELSALVSAAAWLTAWWDHLLLHTGHAPRQVTIAVDNSAALQVACGHAAATLVHSQGVQSRCATHFRHVPGHAGALVNEIVDALAGYASLHSRCATAGWCRLLPTFGDTLAACAPLMWLLPRAQLGPHGLHWRPAGWESPPAQPPAAESRQPLSSAPPTGEPDCPTPLRINFRVVQANIQTIKDVDVSFFNREGHGQRRVYLAKQLQALDVQIAFLQECRSRPGRWSSHGFLSFRSGAEKGLYGVEIWIRPDLLQPALSLDDFRIRHADPRMLLVQCQRAELPITLVAAHAPHSERPEAEARRFWGDFRVHLLSACNRGTVIIGVDANADIVGRDEDEVLVGDLLSLRPPRLNDDLLLACLHDASLAAPGTWAEIHSGPTWTWQHTGGKTQRLDHLLVSSGITVQAHRQYPEFDILNGESRDHMPITALIEVCGRRGRRVQSRCPYAPASGDRVASTMWSLLGDTFSGTCEEQVQRLCDAHDAAVKQLPARPPFLRRQPYLSVAAEVLLTTLRDARAELRRISALQRLQLCRIAFHSWRPQTPGVPRWERHQTQMLRAHYAHVCFKLRAQAHAQARQDKQAYFESLLVGAIDHWHATGRPSEAVAKLSWASKGAKQKRDVRAASGFDIDEQLQLQFQQQEGGRPVSDDQLQMAFSHWATLPRPACAAAVPTLLDVEHMCRAQRRGKAPGPDHIRNEIWKACPDRAGRWLWPMWLRMAWGEAEPLHFKASIVGALHKKGPAHIPANFRSIAMLNGVAKLWHSQLRSTLGQEVIAHYFPTQLGGRKGIDTGLALSVFRSAVDLASVRGHSWAALFVDIQAAYYEADRLLLFQGRDLDSALQGLQLPRHVHRLIQDGVLTGLGVPEDQVALLRDCVECSFWRMVGQPQAIIASRGSRPGDGLADVLFGALFAVILQCLHHALLAEDIVHTASADALGQPDASLQIAWADDLCLLVDFIRAAWAVTKLRRLCAIVLQVFEAFRFRVNLGPGKTEALVHLQGAGANAARKELLSPEPRLDLPDGRSIRVVPEYKYLGVAQRCRDTGRRDIEAAAARGNAIWTQAAGLVHSPHLPWPLKLVWLQGRTLPAAYSSLATTLARSERAWGPLHGFLDKCLRQLVGAWDAGRHVASAQLRACTGVLDVECAVIIARVRLLCRIVSGRSTEAFELFQASWDRGGEWASLLAEAARRVWPASGLPALQPGEPTLLGIRRHLKKLLTACRKISRSGTMLLALQRAWKSHESPTPKRVIGLASPRICSECGATLASAHALAAHMHRLHGRVALCTQYTLGTVCLWCLTEFHNAARLRYHLLHTPECEHGLRCCV